MKRRYVIKLFLLILGITGIVSFWNCLPEPLFDKPVSLMVLDQNGKLIGARIADDEQWRFQEIDSLPFKFREAIVCYEDKRFWKHPGVDIGAIARAVKSNVSAGKIVSGGSTITMQLMRMSRGQKGRTFWQKGIEMVMALRAEIRFNKVEILKQYATHAPFGGNVVGLEAASWRYFGKPPHLLSWAEAATLAVLPNSPSMIHPGKNRNLLLQKRNQLLDQLVINRIIVQGECDLSKLEPIPDQPFPLPQCASHFVNFVQQSCNGKVQTTLDLELQKEIERIVAGHHFLLSQNEIHNLAAIVLETETGAVRAYVGNTEVIGNPHENSVDLVQAERSSGSILKPILYASALEDGLILPTMILPDVPVVMAGYRPENFTRSYEGKVAANEALSRSLNVPAVHLLKDYGLEKFRKKLVNLGFSSIHYTAEHYGLPLILGGAEVKLWDLAGVYGSMGRALNHTYRFNHQYDPSDLHAPTYLPGLKSLDRSPILENQTSFLHYGAIWSVFEAMREVRRPDEDGSWEIFKNAKQVHWKTGTSYGFRDAWAVGVTPKYTVAVWIGNADGEGRPDLVGVRTAAPVMFDIFDLLPDCGKFEAPYDALNEKAVCRASGHPAGRYCDHVDTIFIPNVHAPIDVCTYHVQIWTDLSGQFQLHQNCAKEKVATTSSYFLLDPLSAYYYKQFHPNYLRIPDFHPSCAGDQTLLAQSDFEIAYPPENAEIFLPVDLNNQISSVICQATPENQSEILYWYLDQTFLGVTTDFHTMKIAPPVGKHQLIVVNESGYQVVRSFMILSDQSST